MASYIAKNQIIVYPEKEFAECDVAERNIVQQRAKAEKNGHGLRNVDRLVSVFMKMIPLCASPIKSYPCRVDCNCEDFYIYTFKITKFMALLPLLLKKTHTIVQ